MKNIVKIEYNDKIYEGSNGINPKFYKGLFQLFVEGFFESSTGAFTSITRMLSIHPNFTGHFPYHIDPAFLALSSAGIYIFSENESALNLDKSSISSQDIQYIDKNISSYDLDDVNSYSLTAIDDYSFSIKQNFYYNPPATADLEYVVVDIKSLGVKTAQMSGDTPNYRSPYLPFTYITAKDLIGEESIKLYPAEMITIGWTMNFNSDLDIISDTNGINANIHDTFKRMLCEMMRTDSYTFPSLTSSDRNNFQITGIIGFADPSGALYNNGSTANNTAFFMTPDVDIGGISANSDYSIITYSVSYTNTTGEPQTLGSLLLSGERSSDVFSVVPIAWIGSKELWGTELKILQPKERIKIVWSLKTKFL